MTIEIEIDPNRESVIKAGMKVDFDTPLYTSQERTSVRVEVAETLSIHPKHIFSHLVKNTGDQVEKGEIIALKKQLFSTQTVVAQASGIITEVDHIDGVVLIESDPAIETVETCWFAGEVVSAMKGKLTIKIGRHIVAQATRVSDIFGGELWFLRDENSIIPSFPVACGEAINSYEKAKLEALGVRGAVTTGVIEFETQFPTAQLKDKNVFDHVKQKGLSYCVTQAHHSTIIFYSL